MIPSTVLLATRKTGGSGGAVNWANIVGSGITGTISASNADQTMGSSGTLNFTYAGAGLTYAISKNGVSQGQVASLSVVNTDLVHMTANGTGFGIAEQRTGTITVSGLYSDTIAVTLTDTN